MPKRLISAARHAEEPNRDRTVMIARELWDYAVYRKSRAAERSAPWSRSPMTPHRKPLWSIMMKALIAGTLATGIVLAASPTFSQTLAAPAAPAATPAIPAAPVTPMAPGVKGNANHPEDKAERHQQWKDCMRNQEAKYGGVQTVGQHAGAQTGAPKGGYKSLSKGKPMPPDETADAKKGEKENRHQAEMDDCREQLLGHDGPAPGKK